MRHLPASTAAAAVVFTTALAVAQLGQTPAGGTIAGRVTVMTRVRGTPLPSNVYVPRAVGHHESPAVPEVRNVVVSLKDAAYGRPVPVSRQEIRQEHETFRPRIVAVTKGSVVDFPNDDPFFHNVFSLSSAATFDLGRYPQGNFQSRRFITPGLVKVYCHIHAQMSASILVFDHPFFAVPDVAGDFTIPAVPPGRYTIVAWHERVGERAETIQVTSGKPTAVELSLPVGDRR